MSAPILTLYGRGVSTGYRGSEQSMKASAPAVENRIGVLMPMQETFNGSLKILFPAQDVYATHVHTQILPSCSPPLMSRVRYRKPSVRSSSDSCTPPASASLKISSPASLNRSQNLSHAAPVQHQYSCYIYSSLHEASRTASSIVLPQENCCFSSKGLT